MSNALPNLTKAILLLPALLCAETGASTIPEPAPIKGKGYSLIKNWDFGSTIQSVQEMRDAFFTRYIYSDGKLDHLNDEWQRYRDNQNHVIVNDSLHLVARAQGRLQKGKIESGMIRSKWSGQYGYIECRIKMPKGRGFWPACWLNPEDQKWPPEIDIVEIVNNGDDGTRSGFHFVHEGRNQKRPKVIRSLLNKRHSYKPGVDYSEGFHTFAVEWTKERVRHYVDDVLVVEREFYWKHSNGTDGGDAHILVNLGVGGKWAGPPTSFTDFPAALEIDYIRVWQVQTAKER